MHQLLETFTEYLDANAEMVRLTHLNLDEDSVDYKKLTLLTDKVFIYEIRNFPVFYNKSPYVRALHRNSTDLDEVLEELSLM